MYFTNVDTVDVAKIMYLKDNVYRDINKLQLIQIVPSIVGQFLGQAKFYLRAIVLNNQKRYVMCLSNVEHIKTGIYMISIHAHMQKKKW